MTAPADFLLDPLLESDTYALGRMALCRVLLMGDARYPWLILVPERAGLAEIIDLAPADQALLLTDITGASRALQAAVGPDKLNVAALGNQVRQLHVHVIARFVSDEAWPNPVWGRGQAVPYPPHMVGVLIDRLTDALTREGMRAEGAAS
jgi:diadenosine tetraphosphate (Ap4A) HIT family hydrolase